MSRSITLDFKATFVVLILFFIAICLEVEEGRKEGDEKHEKIKKEDKNERKEGEREGGKRRNTLTSAVFTSSFSLISWCMSVEREP